MTIQLSSDGAPIVDQLLAEALAEMPDPREEIIRDDGMAMWLNAQGGSMLKSRRIVRLKCGHFALTRNLNSCACPRCGAMIRAGYDFDGFRRLGHLDRFDWPADPLGGINQSGIDRIGPDGSRWIEPKGWNKTGDGK